MRRALMGLVYYRLPVKLSRKSRQFHFLRVQAQNRLQVVEYVEQRVLSGWLWMEPMNR